MAEYCVSHIVALERKFSQLAAQQTQRQWTQVKSYRRLGSLHVGILGYGDIGQELARVLKEGFGVKVRKTQLVLLLNANNIIR